MGTDSDWTQTDSYTACKELGNQLSGTFFGFQRKEFRPSISAIVKGALNLLLQMHHCSFLFWRLRLYHLPSSFQLLTFMKHNASLPFLTDHGVLIMMYTEVLGLVQGYEQGS
jgi:hypothetical protein